MNSASIAGATGLVGSKILAELAGIGSVQAWARRPVDFPPGVQTVVSPELPQGSDGFWRSETLFVALGTTIAKAGSRDAFEAVDLELVVECARRARDAGCGTLAMVSAEGANIASRFFYSRVKGWAEQSVIEIGFPRTVIVRPSLLLGDRKELRLGELVARKCLGPLRGAIPRSIRPVRDVEVARALVGAAKDVSWTGVRILRNREIVGQEFLSA